jgi:hypothetical protein
VSNTRPMNFRWNVDLMVMDLLESLHLPFASNLRLYNLLHGQFDQLVDAIESGGEWPLQLVDRRFARFPGGKGIHDIEGRSVVDELDHRPVESLAYDLAEMARRRDAARGGDRDGHGDPDVAEEGVRRGPG